VSPPPLYTALSAGSKANRSNTNQICRISPSIQHCVSELQNQPTACLKLDWQRS